MIWHIVDKRTGQILWATLILSFIMLGLSLSGGCTTEKPNVNVMYVSGSGAVGVEVYNQPLEVEWREAGFDLEGELIHCSIIDRLSISGIAVGAGYLPPPISDERCAAFASPFRTGAYSSSIAPVMVPAPAVSADPN